ncbi:MAG: sulfur carrier protein ThiS [Lachnospiraceae bacterium]
MVLINGKKENTAGVTISQYLSAENYDSKKVAIEKNGKIVPKSQYDTLLIEENDHLEVVSFVGGG